MSTRQTKQTEVLEYTNQTNFIYS